MCSATTTSKAVLPPVQALQYWYNMGLTEVLKNREIYLLYLLILNIHFSSEDACAKRLNPELSATRRENYGAKNMHYIKQY